ncbi:hypothetical protein [Phenylobacterium sp.]|uniref:hypothetical protein n=1 Tax=Phenylobacterium sp. TaxID=1871053 RepID=UPI002C51CD2A|nr:hypothetical protein [Phenylobacterium sp.]HVI33773.1 hypothetical protein [Phenylobacterium sp.]
MARRSPTPIRNSLSLKLGGWLEAHATGWGVVAIPIVVVLVLAAEGLRLWLG